MPDKSGQTCLHVAAASGHYDMVQVLLGQGSDYNTVDKVKIVFIYWPNLRGTDGRDRKIMIFASPFILILLAILALEVVQFNFPLDPNPESPKGRKCDSRSGSRARVNNTSVGITIFIGFESGITKKLNIRLRIWIHGRNHNTSN